MSVHINRFYFELMKLKKNIYIYIYFTLSRIYHKTSFAVSQQIYR